jgi:hypothetical protein
VATSLESYREAKVEKASLARRAAQAECKRMKLSVLKVNPKLHKAVNKADRRRMRATRRTSKEINMRETQKSEWVNRRVSWLQGELRIKNAK